MTHNTLTISDVLKMKSLSFPEVSRFQLSPDGESLAYIVKDPNRKSSSEQKTTESSKLLPTGAPDYHHCDEVWVTNIKTKESYQLGSDVGVDWAPRWSPDGRYVAFCSDRMGAPQLWVWDKIENKQRRISEKPISIISGYEVPQWTSDGKYLITKLRSENIDFSTIISPDSAGQVINVWHSDTDEQLDSDEELSRFAWNQGDLGVFNVDTGDVSFLTRGLYVVDIFLSPDDTAVAVLNIIGAENLTSQDVFFELLLVPLDGSPIRCLATNIRFGSRFVSWAPNGKQLIYTHPDGLFLTSTQGDEQKNLTANFSETPHFFTRPLWNASGTSVFCGFDGHVWEIATDGSNTQKLTEGLDRHITGFVAKRDTHVIWESNEEQSICIRTHDPQTKKDGFYLINTAAVKTTRLFEQQIYLSTPSGNGTKLLYRAQNATSPEEVWMYDTVSGKQQRVTDLNPHLRGLRFGEVRFIESKTVEGKRLRGVLMLPANYEEGKRYPLITKVYPGQDLSRSIYTFGLGVEEINFQLLAAQGFAVLGVDMPPESTDSLADMPGYVLPAIDEVIEIGIADENRLGIMGFSYGGYCTVGVITQTTRFKAAVCGGGLYNLTSFYGQLSKGGASTQIGWAETGQGRMGGSLWEQRQRYIDNSPIFYLDKIETPVLIYCGEGFGGSDYVQSGELFSGLRRLKKKATFVWYRGEGHPATAWRPEHQIDYQKRIIDWFEKHLI
ncbi:MAG: prolyl oligopeptidase family serine peptidase [Candidatus Poribacteria bacterium]|nr:prolyl oligopeptidase family serine peptidase [Candidatus Poribacteria bacterium]